MASFKITDLTELAGGSVADTDVLEIVDLDADQSKKVTISSLKTVFSASEGSSYTGGTANGIMFNDGNTFATSANIIYNNELIVNSNGVSGSGGGRERVVTFKGTLPEILILDTTYRGFAYSLYNNQVYFRHTNTSGAYVNNVGQIQLSSGKWTIGDGTNPTGQLDVNVQLSSIIGQRINLSNGQTADAFQINSFGNTGGDLFRVEADGDVTVSSGRIYGETSNQYVLLDSAIGSGFYYNSQNYIYHGGRFQVVAANVNSMSVRNTKSSFNTPLYIGGFDVTPDASSILEINSTTQGVLLPRMTTTERDAISSPATGLLIFNTTTVKLEYYSGTAWGQV